MEASVNNPKNLLNEPPQPQLPENENNKKQALTNLGIFIAIFIILLMGVKFATWSATKWSDTAEEEAAAEEELVVDKSGEEGNSEKAEDVPEMAANISSIVEGAGEVALSVSSKSGDVVREVFLHNPYKNSWLLVYEGYRSVGGDPVEIYRINLSPIKFDKVRVRTLKDLKDFDKEVDVQNGSSVNLLLEL